MQISFRLNGKDVSTDIDPLKKLSDALRDDFDCKGVKEGCSEGECGACSILLNDKLVTSCIIPVAGVDKQDVKTIEYIRETEKGKVIIQAFADGGAVQCGFCIPGMVMATYYLLENNPNPTEEEIRLGLSGNICRCTGYDLIVKCVQLAVKRGSKLWNK